MTETADHELAAPGPHLALVSGVLDELPEAIVVIDADERVAYANDRIRDPYGVGPADAIGRPLAEILTLPEFVLRIENRQGFLEAALTALDAPGERHEHLFRCTDGSTYLQRLVPATAPTRGRLVITANVTGLRARNRQLEVGAAEAPPRRPALRLLRGGLDER
ncbi:MAG: PAS domain-containing protein [Thermoleophilia bacterium]|nr:PAS domain-containing protein [Thermoleophilia bacterium]